MFLLFFIIINIIMNQILLYKVNNNYRKYYKYILIGIILLIVLVFGMIYKSNRNIKNEMIILNVVNNKAKIEEIYNIGKLSDLNEDKYLGRIIINKIGVNYMVLDEYSENNLKESICRFSGNIDSKNISLIGHNYENGIFFSNLNILDNDDEIILVIDDKILVYKVYKKYEVNSNDLTPIEEGILKEITLITCNNLNKKRLIIKAYLYN